MNILLISNGFADSKVHRNLTKALDGCGVEQTVYCPVREERLLGKNQFVGNKVKFVYSNCIRSWYKYFYHYKIWQLFRDISNNIELRDFDIIQASTLFSDGGLALKIHKKYSIPYIVAVRNTDINLYIKKLKHTHTLGHQILLNSEKIVFISKGEMNEFSESQFVKPIFKQIQNKILIQPNGIEDYWHQNITQEKRKGHDILYIGDYSPNKNVIRLAQAINLLRKEEKYQDTRLIVVGGEKKGKAWKYDNSTKKYIENNPDSVKALGRIEDKEKLISIMRSCAVFAMPSIFETFGLVYIEALSQNLPVIYTKGQGIDGLFDDSVGIPVDAFSVDDIKIAIKKILDNPERFNNTSVDFKQFDWKIIANHYIKLYNEILKPVL